MGKVEMKTYKRVGVIEYRSGSIMVLEHWDRTVGTVKIPQHWYKDSFFELIKRAKTIVCTEEDTAGRWKHPIQRIWK